MAVIQPRIIVKYTCITDFPRVVHEITFTSNREALSFVREHSRWFAQTQVDREIEIIGTLTMADF